MDETPQRRAYDRDRSGEYVTWKDIQELMERHTESERTLRHGLRNEMQQVIGDLERRIDTLQDAMTAGFRAISEKIDHLFDPNTDGHGREHKLIEAERNQRLGMERLIKVLVGSNALTIIAALVGFAKAFGWL